LVSEEDVSTADAFYDLMQNSVRIQASGSWHCPLIIMPAGSPSIELFKGVPISLTDKAEAKRRSGFSPRPLI
jgi:hypothetical protein